MVAAEAACCGSPRGGAALGLAEIAAGLEAEYPPEYSHLAAFTPGDVDDLTAKLRAILVLPPSQSAPSWGRPRDARRFASGVGRGSRPASWP